VGVPGNLVCVRDRDEAVVGSYPHGLLRVDLETGAQTPLLATNQRQEDLDETFFYDLGASVAAAFSPEGQWLALDWSHDGWAGVHLHHFPTHRWWPLRQGAPAGGVHAMRFTAWGELAVAHGDGSLRLWDPGTQQLLGTFLTGSQWQWIVPYGTPYGFR